MEAQKREGTISCDHKCENCSLGHHAMPTSGGDLTGVRLVAAGALTFLFPLILAIVGAIVSGGGKTRQLIGGIIGMAVGVLIAVVTVRLLKKTDDAPSGSDTPDVEICDIKDSKEHR